MQYILLFLTLLTVSSGILAENVFLSIGGDCTIAGVLRELNMRKAAYPFDWMFSDFESLYMAFKDDFKHFLDPQFLVVASDRRTILDFYGFKFVHDFPTVLHNASLTETEVYEQAEIRDDWRNFIDPIKEKYERRIQRLRTVLHGSDHVFFIRFGLKKEEAIMLRDVFIAQYPQLQFTIVAVNKVLGVQNEAISSNIDEWDLDHIQSFTIPWDQPDFWDRWKYLFRILSSQTCA